MAGSEMPRLQALWKHYRDRMPANGRPLVVYDWLPTDNRFRFSAMPHFDDISNDLPNTVRFEMRRVVCADDPSTEAIQIFANGAPIAVEGYRTRGL